MRSPRRSRAWTAVAGIALPEGTPAELVRLLAARRAWRRIAGPSLAGRLPVLRLEGETLVLGLPEASWHETLPEIERQVGAPLASALPGIRSLRGEVLLPSAHPSGPRQSAPAPGAVATGERGDKNSDGDAMTRLKQLAAAILSRQERSGH